MDISCTVCLDSYLNEDDEPEVSLIPCGHLFHEFCLQEWLKKNKSCPQCRTPAFHECIFRVYWERTPVGKSEARRSAKAARENKLLRMEVDALEKSVNSIKKEMRETRAACAELVAEHETKAAAWRDVSSTHFKRISVLKLRISALKSSLKESEERVGVVEKKRRALRKLLWMRDIELDRYRQRCDRLKRKLALAREGASKRKVSKSLILLTFFSLVRKLSKVSSRKGYGNPWPQGVRGNVGRWRGRRRRRLLTNCEFASFRFSRPSSKVSKQRSGAISSR